MELSSARELKKGLTDVLTQPGAGQVTAKQKDTRSSDLGGQTLRTLALGVAPHPDGKKFHLAVRVQSHDMVHGPEVDLIRKHAKGEVDVRYTGPISKHGATSATPVPWYQQVQRPMLIGSSIGHIAVSGGTLGSFVRSRSDGTLYVLSNNHVLANENAGQVGDGIVQAGIWDYGQIPADLVAKLAKFIPLNVSGSNSYDCAIATIDAGIQSSLGVLKDIGQITGIADASDGTPVQKIGRSTGHTTGKVTAFEVDSLVIGFGIGNLSFDDQIEIEGDNDAPFSDDGDSGSLIFDANRCGVGLLFAGSTHGGSNGHGLSYANPLRGVLDALEVDLAF